ncbi:MAG: ATP-dependent zinc protease [Halieaceae bacterium]|nr:ATP-dependent zinc protease [Halieaceae bacterium]
MKILSRPLVYLALSLAAGCGSVAQKPAPAVCAPPEPASCPVCPQVEPQVLQCPEPQVIEKIVKVPVPAPPPPRAATAGKLDLPIVGAVEWATVEPGGIRMPARIDTGAATTSIHAQDIELVEKDGKRWVHYSLVDPATDEKVQVEQRLHRKVVIKQSDGEDLRRYVVRMWITIGEARALVDVALSDREQMEYPLSIGRNMLVDTVIVDVSRKNLAGKPGDKK